jgi:hypothetical protein
MNLFTAKSDVNQRFGSDTLGLRYLFKGAFGCTMSYENIVELLTVKMLKVVWLSCCETMKKL